MQLNIRTRTFIFFRGRGLRSLQETLPGRKNDKTNKNVCNSFAVKNLLRLSLKYNETKDFNRNDKNSQEKK